MVVVGGYVMEKVIFFFTRLFGDFQLLLMLMMWCFLRAVFLSYFCHCFSYCRYCCSYCNRVVLKLLYCCCYAVGAIDVVVVVMMSVEHHHFFLSVFVASRKPWDGLCH